MMQGKTALAMAALRRLGEDIDVTLYELAFGTVRRGLRKQMRAELRRSTNRLGSRDCQLLEITSFLEVSSVHSCLGIGRSPVWLHMNLGWLCTLKWF